MNVNQKIFVGVFSVLIWIVALYIHHQYSDIDMTAMITLCQAVLVGLGVTHLTSSSDVANTINMPPYEPPPTGLSDGGGTGSS